VLTFLWNFIKTHSLTKFLFYLPKWTIFVIRLIHCQLQHIFVTQNTFYRVALFEAFLYRKLTFLTNARLLENYSEALLIRFSSFFEGGPSGTAGDHGSGLHPDHVRLSEGEGWRGQDLGVVAGGRAVGDAEGKDGRRTELRGGRRQRRVRLETG